MDIDLIYRNRLANHDSLALLLGGREPPTEALDAVLDIARTIEPDLGDTHL